MRIGTRFDYNNDFEFEVNFIFQIKDKNDICIL